MSEEARTAHRTEMQERMKNMSPEEMQAMEMGRDRGMQGAGNGRGHLC
jgi:hypothetical protein